MRVFNESHPGDPVRLVGVSPHETGVSAYDTVAGYVRGAEPALMDELERCYAGLRPEGDVSAHTSRFRALSDRRSFRDRAPAAYDLVAGAPGHDGHAWALHNARLIVQYYELHDHDDDPLARTTCLLRAVLRRERPVVAAAHRPQDAVLVSSSHTADARTRVVSFPPGPAAPSRNAGSYLREHLGTRYLSIGIIFGAGELATYTGAPAHRVPGPVPPLGDYLLDLRTDAPRKVADWLTRTSRSRLIGPRHDPRRDTGHHMTGGSPSEWFDVLAHLRQVTPARPFHRPPP
ncbi:erythromycin esterase family protein [Streptomyces sp. NPDC017520]|uniref:erythromycin esterase family protein n=1 Tax=Streptomyces sp. NPDC017520 TaxID=3364998 RepID=UPI00378EBCC9